MKNYRPVVLLSVAGMILERVVAMQIEEYFEKNKLFSSFQFGFRKNKNTTSELLTLFDAILEAKEMKKEILVLLYDLSSAFDTVCHKILLKMKWTDMSETSYSLRSITKNDLNVPMKPSPKCLGFTYNGSKLFNLLPIQIRETLNQNFLKSLTKKWIWENIPAL